MKRALNGLCTPLELPPSEAAVVDATLERWERVRLRAFALKPVLQREQELIQEILDRGLRGEDRKTLRRLATGGNGDEAEAIQQVAASIGAEAENLQEILLKNHRELLELTARMPEDKEEILKEFDEVKSSLRIAQTAVHGELLRAKEGPDKEMVRSFGRSFNNLKALMRKLEADRHEVSKNSTLAALLV